MAEVTVCELSNKFDSTHVVKDVDLEIRDYFVSRSTAAACLGSAAGRRVRYRKRKGGCMSAIRTVRNYLLAATCSIMGLVCLGSTPAIGQEAYPYKPVRLVNTFGVGGISDVVARLVAGPLGEELKQPVLVENRLGAGGNVGAQAVAKAAPDGYTLLLGTMPTQIVNPMIYSQPGYDPWTDFVPVSLLGGVPFLLAMGNIPGVKDLQGVIAYAKANPGKLNYGTAGAGGYPHLGMELFKLATQTQITHVPYKSGAEAVSATVAGHVQLVVDVGSVIVPHAKTGRLTLLAMTTAQRDPSMPDLKTGVEQGLPEFKMNAAFYGIAAPASTPKDRIAILNAALVKVLERPALAARFSEMGITRMPLGTDAYAKLLREEQELWGRIVKIANVKID